MKPTILLILFLFTNISFSQNQSAYQAECITANNEGSVTIKIWNTKRGKRYKIEEAQKDALHLLLYSGLQSNKSCIGQKPLLNNQKEIDAFSKIDSDFFNKNGLWSKYTRASNLNATLPTSIGNKNWAVYEITISEKQLRLFLEEKKIIKSLDSVF